MPDRHDLPEVEMSKMELLALEFALARWRNYHNAGRLDAPEGGVSLRFERGYALDYGGRTFEFWEYRVQLGKEEAKAVVRWEKGAPARPSVHATALREETTTS